MIIRVNMHDIKYNKSIPYHVKVDRSTKLGNPYTISEYGSKDLVCDMYNDYFISEMKKGGTLYKEVLNLVDIYRKYNILVIHCWCPLDDRCHSDIIVNTVKLLAKELES